MFRRISAFARRHVLPLTSATVLGAYAAKTYMTPHTSAETTSSKSETNNVTGIPVPTTSFSSLNFLASNVELDLLEEETEADEQVANYDDEDLLDVEALKKLYVHTSDNADLRIFSGTGNHLLAHAVAAQLNVQLGRAKVTQYHDGEVSVQILDSVRGKDCYIMQSLCGPNPHDQLMELLLLVSALKRSSAGRIVAVVPYMAYARQLDSLATSRDFIPASDIAKMLEALSVDHVVCVDLHRPQFIGFFHNAVCENLDTTNSFLPYLEGMKHIKDRHVTVVSPIGNVVKRAVKLRDALEANGVDAKLGFTYLVNPLKNNELNSSEYKEHHAQIDRSEMVRLVGEIEGRDAIIVTDMVDSASRISAVAESLKSNGAKDIYAIATHGLFTGNAIERIEESPLNEVIVFDTIPLPPAKHSRHVRQLSAAGLIAETIKRIHSNKSTVNLEHRYGEYTD